MQEKVVIGTRGSKLALWQAYFTKDKLEAAGIPVELKIIKTKGDKIQHLSFDKLEGKGFFTKEIEDALLNRDIDLAVHSSKDLSTESPEGLTIGAFSYRAAPNDTLLIRKDCADAKQFLQMKQNAVVGTSSARRKAQLLSFRKDISLKDIRGNVPTRIQKLREGQFDAILLAAAGLNRLEIDTAEFIRVDLSATMYIPAPAQGILAYQNRTNDAKVAAALEVLNDSEIFTIANIERDILNAFDGGCQMPLGVYVEPFADKYNVWVSKATAWDATPKRMHFEVSSPVDKMAIKELFECDKITSVFISREIQENDFLKNNLEGLGHTLSGEPFIDFTAESFTIESNHYDWIFFPSKNAVKYFLEQEKNIPAGVKIAAVNKGTAFALQQLGFSPDFIGNGGDLNKIARDFDSTEGKNVLFARAKNSRRSIQKTLVNKTISEVAVYDNFVKLATEKRSEEILVFTSPMNVKGYFEHFQLDDNQKVVAIGTPTKQAIEQFGYSAHVAYEPTMWAILDVVLKVMV